MSSTPFHRNAFALSFAALVLVAWASLYAWGASPWAAYLHRLHGASGLLCLSPLQGSFGTAAALYVAGWTLMVVAMMLPTTLPLAAGFRRMVRTRTNRAQLTLLLLCGYMLAWLAFGVIAWAANQALQAVLLRSHWLIIYPWALGAAALVVAGLFQFSRLKQLCLDKCRTPFGFMASHWRGQRPSREALLLGLHHGAFCVGCCWALMFLMFALGLVSVGWMLLLSLPMVIEKNMSWGHRLSTPLGVALVAAGIGLALANT